MTTLKHRRAQIAALCERIAAQVPSNAFGTLAKIQAFRENSAPLSGRRLADALREHGRPDLAAEVEQRWCPTSSRHAARELLPTTLLPSATSSASRPKRSARS